MAQRLYQTLLRSQEVDETTELRLQTEERNGNGQVYFDIELQFGHAGIFSCQYPTEQCGFRTIQGCHGQNWEMAGNFKNSWKTWKCQDL